MEKTEVTVAKYPDRRELTIGRTIPTGNVEMYTVTLIPSEELKAIMEAKSEEVQKLLQPFI